MIRLLQITDTHLFADTTKSLVGINTYNSLKAIIQQINQSGEQPDLIILTGDLSQDGSTDSYEHLLAQFKIFNCPIYWILGNHDSAIALNQILTPSYFNNDKIIDLDSWKIILLNTHIPGKVSGDLADDQLELLQRSLANTKNQGCLVMLHHHPITINSEWLDKIGLQHPKAFLDIIEQAPAVKAVVWGHIHQDFNVIHNDILFIATPSTCIQFKPKQKNFTLDEQQPGYRWIRLQENGSLTTEVFRLPSNSFLPDLTVSGY